MRYVTWIPGSILKTDGIQTLTFCKLSTQLDADSLRKTLCVCVIFVVAVRLIENTDVLSDRADATAT